MVIACSLLNSRSWEILLEHNASPLTDAGSTIYFAGLDALSSERSRQLLASLIEMDVCRRNRVIFSCISRPEEYVSATGSLSMDKLGCVSLYLPPLQQLGDDINTLVGLTLNHMNSNLSARAAGVEPEALELLRHFPGPTTKRLGISRTTLWQFINEQPRTQKNTGRKMRPVFFIGKGKPRAMPVVQKSYTFAQN